MIDVEGSIARLNLGIDLIPHQQPRTWNVTNRLEPITVNYNVYK
jgi:hypothetical protein